jgi:hypothetical protein
MSQYRLGHRKRFMLVQQCRARITKAVPTHLRQSKAPGQFFQVVHDYNGDSTWMDDGRFAWVAQLERDAPAPSLALVLKVTPAIE